MRSIGDPSMLLSLMFYIMLNMSVCGLKANRLYSSGLCICVGTREE